MSEKWYIERWKARLGDVPPGRAFWLSGKEYAWFGFSVAMTGGMNGEANGWLWETGELVCLDTDTTVFWFRDGNVKDEWRLAIHMLTRVVQVVKYKDVDNQVPNSLREVYRRIAPLVDGQQVIGWRKWMQDVLGSPRDFLKA